MYKKTFKRNKKRVKKSSCFVISYTFSAIPVIYYDLEVQKLMLFDVPKITIKNKTSDQNN